jgi:hypothetical protein
MAARDDSSWQQEWQIEQIGAEQEQQRQQAAREEQERRAEVPYGRNTWREARGRRKVYIVQTCHWEYDDAIYDWSVSGGASLLAFTTEERARDYLLQQRPFTEATLGIVEVYLDTDLDET